MDKRVVMLILAFFLAGTTFFGVIRAGAYTSINVSTAYDMITGGSFPDLVVLDVRTKSEYNSGHIYGAVWIPQSDLDARITELAGHENHEIIVYCLSGGRSVMASNTLDAHHFTKVYNMLTGITGWQSAGYPLWIATVHNLDTTYDYDTIQAAIDTPQTLDGHTIQVEDGTYHEHVLVNKKLVLIGQHQETTIIDGNGQGSVLNILVDNVRITRFTIRNGNIGIQISNSSHTTLQDNSISQCNSGVILQTSFNNTLRSNSLSANQHNLEVTSTLPSDLSPFLHDIDPSNTVNGKPIYYLVNQSNTQVPVDVGYVAIVNSINIQIEGNEMVDNGQGILLVNSTNCTVRNVTLSNNREGLSFWTAHNNTIIHNNFLENTFQVSLHDSYNNTWDDGFPSGGNYWSNYTGTDWNRGVFQNESGTDGLGDTAYTIEVSNQDHYPLMKGYSGPNDVAIINFTTSQTIVTQGTSLSMTAKISNYGINSETFNVTAYSNGVSVNQTQILLERRNSTTITLVWNTTGAPTGDYVISGEADSVPGETDTTDNTYVDGVVMVLSLEHDVAIQAVTPSKPAVAQGYTIPINVTAMNYGGFLETFDIIVSANTTIITTFSNVTLPSPNTVPIPLIWNTTDLAYGDYTITALASIVPGETYTTDNSQFSWVMVTIAGDANGDRKVNYIDLGLLAYAYGSTPTSGNWDARADCDDSLKVNFIDLGLLAAYYGQSWGF